MVAMRVCGSWGCGPGKLELLYLDDELSLEGDTCGQHACAYLGTYIPGVKTKPSKMQDIDHKRIWYVESIWLVEIS